MKAKTEAPYALVQIVDLVTLDQAVVGLAIKADVVLVAATRLWMLGVVEPAPGTLPTLHGKYRAPLSEAVYMINEIPASSGVTLDDEDEARFVWRLLNPDTLRQACRGPCGTVEGWDWTQMPEPSDMDYHFPQDPPQLKHKGPVAVASDPPTALPPTVERVRLSGRSASTAEALACAMEVLQVEINGLPRAGLRATYEAAMSTLQAVFQQVGCEEISEVVHGHRDVARLTDNIDTIVFG